MGVNRYFRSPGPYPNEKGWQGFMLAWLLFTYIMYGIYECILYVYVCVRVGVYVFV